MRVIKVHEDANRIVIDREHYDSQEEYRNAIGNAILFLLNERHQMKVYQEIESMTIIDYTWAEPELGRGIEIVKYEDCD